MTTKTIIYIIIAGIAALTLALFQYMYKSKKQNKLYKGLSILRFFTVFAILLLLINPKFESVSYEEEKPNLAILIDNSESIEYLNKSGNAKAFIKNLQSNTDLKDQFNVDYYSFGSSFKSVNTDSINFSDNRSDLYEALRKASDVYDGTTTGFILVTDGNQTLGQDYQYFKKNDFQINTVILGDTTKYTDVSIRQVNVNRYAYLKNKFPVEMIVNYSGNNPITTTLQILSRGRPVYSKAVEFNAEKTSEIITTNLSANAVGVQSYQVKISTLDNERNTVNNIKNFAVEVIDQKTNIALVTDIIHPDIGAIKKSIETNEQRSVTIINPIEETSELNDFQLFILYQPNRNFKQLLSNIFKEKRNTFLISGNTTDWQFLNNEQSFYIQEVTNQSEEYQPSFNRNFSPFIVDDLNFEDFPPLVSEFGELKFSSQPEVILNKSINSITTNQVLLGTFETDGQKHAVLNGEGIWRWRAHTFLERGSFNEFDILMGKLVQYLSSNKRRSRLSLDYSSFYNGNENVTINAQYFNKTFEFDPNASILVTLKNNEDNITQDFPLILRNSIYSVDLSGIAPGDYTFTVKNINEPISASGAFKVLEYNVEQQFLNADVQKLKALAESTGGRSYFVDNPNTLVSDLLSNSKYTTVQKEKLQIVPLIDWKYLLGFIVLALSLEWFIRKYNGLI